MSSDSSTEVAHLDLFGEINYASLSTIDLSIASIRMTSEGEEIDYIKPSIPHPGDREQRKEKKGRGRGFRTKKTHSCISEWRVTMTDGASGASIGVCSIYKYTVGMLYAVRSGKGSLRKSCARIKLQSMEHTIK
jgi:hypothetical protein